MLYCHGVASISSSGFTPRAPTAFAFLQDMIHEIYHHDKLHVCLDAGGAVWL